MAKKRGSKARLMRSTSKKIQIGSNDSNTIVCSVCGGCWSRGSAWLFLVLGILFLFRDLGFFPWWTVSWWTLLFLIVGYWSLKKNN